MNKFKKDYSLLNGKGEWIEDEHPRDEKGRFTDKAKSNKEIKDENLNIDIYGINDIINLEEFVPAESKKQAENYAKNELGVKICNYNGIDLDVANELNAVVQKGIILCPKIKENLNFIGSLNELNNLYEKDLIDFYFQQFHSSVPQLGNDRCLNMAKAFAERLKIKFDNKVYAISYKKINMADERVKIYNKYAGVSINEVWGKDKNIILANVKKDVEDRWHPQGCDTIKSIFDHEIGHQLDYALNLRNNKHMINLYNSISKFNKSVGLSIYSNESIQEFIAEGWTEYTNNPYPRDIAKEIGKIIKKELES